VYFIFKAETQQWQDCLLQAELQETFDTSMLFSREWHWWDAKPSVTSFPLFTFTIDPTAPQPDNYYPSHSIDLYSNRLIALLRKAGVHFETFPAEFRSSKTNDLLPCDYQVFHLLEKHPVMDKQQSVIEEERMGSMMIPEIRKFVLTEACLEEKRPLFRVLEVMNLVLIHESLKKELIAAGITGCDFAKPAESYETGMEALRKALNRIVSS
jgi:hypothetical protein